MARDRDEQFEELFQYYPAVVKLLRNLGFGPEDARDLAQQVFVRVYEHMDGYRGEARLSYLHRVTRRLASNFIRDRHAAKREGVIISTDEILDLRDQRDLADRSMERREDVDRLQHAIGQLSRDDQTALRLQLAGHSLQDIAAVLGITISALKSRFHVARGKLRELLGEDPEGLDGRDD
jgi:RNA polymerase sigma-70 factor, ECF subfamily